ncbi:MAG: lipoate--protein ligase family protein [Candidatus Bathyarchaeota archaeon]|nr:lipoate--protein ligase family protein [Candidatus Bathyarchaeota archaeon]
MKTWRLLDLETHDAFMNMAIDEAILISRTKGEVPNTLRFYRWKPSTVSIGRFQKVENEVNVENLKELGVDVVRRISGGGTVYHDETDEVTYSVTANPEDMGASDITEVYSRIYAAITESLRMLGITADYNPGDKKNCPNLMVQGKKISGSAQANKGTVVLQHGTLLLGIDLPRMFTLLRVPWANSCMQVVDVAKRKITSVELELGHRITYDTAVSALMHGFKVVFNISLKQGELTTQEKQLAQKLYKEKYQTKEWNYDAKAPSI